MPYADALQGPNYRAAGEGKPALQDRTLATPLIVDREHAKRPPIKQLIVHEIYTPALLRADRRGRRPTIQRHALPAPHAHPKRHLIPRRMLRR